MKAVSMGWGDSLSKSKVHNGRCEIGWLKLIWYCT
jgi:hypothetical protein